MASKRQRRIGKTERSCRVCGGSARVISITQLLYVPGAKLTASRREMVCEACLIRAVKSERGTKERENVAGALLGCVVDVYKAIRGVS